MSSTGLAVFDSTIQETNRWLTSLLRRIGGEDRHRAYLVLRAGLHTLRDRLEVPAVAHLAAQLPMLIRGIFYEGWSPAHGSSKERHLPEFFEHFRSQLPPGMALNADHAVRAVFGVILEMIDPGEVQKVMGSLPRDLRELWVDH